MASRFCVYFLAVGVLLFSYEIILKDGKYESMILNCDYAIAVEGLTCNIDFEISAEYTYNNVQNVVVPSDAASYTEVDYDDIMG